MHQVVLTSISLTFVYWPVRLRFSLSRINYLCTFGSYLCVHFVPSLVTEKWRVGRGSCEKYSDAHYESNETLVSTDPGLRCLRLGFVRRNTVNQWQDSAWFIFFPPFEWNTFDLLVVNVCWQVLLALTLRKKKKKPLNPTMIQKLLFMSLEELFELEICTIRSLASLEWTDLFSPSFCCFFLKRDETSVYIEIMTVNSMLRWVLSLLRLLYILWVIKKWVI